MKMQTKLQNQAREEYKQTELGLLPKEWKVVRLGDIFTEVDKKTRRTEIFPEENYKIILTKLYAKGIQLKEIKPGGKISAKYMYVIKDGDFIFSKINLRKGAFDFVPSELSGAVVSTEHPILKLDRQKANQQYVKFYFSQPFTWELFKREAKGFSGKERIKVREFMTVKIPLPPLQKQKAIAFVLSTIQTAKEKTEQVIQATKELKKSLMKHLFTYGPVSLKDAEKVKLKETEIGKIPEGWDVVRLIETAEKDSDIVGGPFGSNLKVSDYKNSGVPIIRLQNIERNMFVNKDIKYVSEEKAEELRYHSFRAGDIILAKLGDPIGKTCIVPDYLTKGIVVADVARIRTKEDITDKKYIVHVLNSSFVEKQFRQQKTGTTRPRVNVSNVRNIKIPLPPLQTQKKIASILSAVDEKIEKEENKKKALEELFKSMLYNLMSAKIRVKDLGG